MKPIPIMIACLLLAVNVYADRVEGEDAGSYTQEETNAATDTYVRHDAPAVPSWSGANVEPPLNDYEGEEPSYDDTDEPSFQPDPR